MLTINTHDKRLHSLQRVKDDSSDTVFIWGNGEYAQIIRRYLRDRGVQKRFISMVDDECYTTEMKNVIPLSEFLQQYNHLSPIVFGFYNYKVIQEKKKRWMFELPNLYDFHLGVVNGRCLAWDGATAKQKEQDYQITYDLLSDAQSKKVMQLYLGAAVEGEFDRLFEECYEEPSYFNRITSKIQIDTLVDCGAFDGDSIHDFINAFPDYARIIAFEPDPGNRVRLNKRVIAEEIDNLIVIDKGVGKKDAVLSFKDDGKSNAFFSEEGSLQVPITTVDSVFNQLLGTTMLKMDIEGSELSALQGAKRLIQAKHPILAICVYHKEEDLIEIPQYIHGLVGEGIYNYYLGFHGLDLAELVFYAIPKDTTSR